MTGILWISGTPVREDIVVGLARKATICACGCKREILQGWQAYVLPVGSGDAYAVMPHHVVYSR